MNNASLKNSCRYWRGMAHQRQAWEYLESAIEPKAQEYFAAWWRNTLIGGDINLASVPVYYDARSWQDQALDVLDQWLPDSIKQEFTRIWRSAPSEVTQPAVGMARPIDWHDPLAHVSQFFTVGEVTRGDSRRIPQQGSDIEANILKLASELDQLRERFGPIGVTSWYRPPVVNQEVGGVPNSTHLWGIAADIFPYNDRGQAMQDWLEANWKGGVGRGWRYRQFIHVNLPSATQDYRDVRWDY